jgi:hypothetical protein
VTEVALTVWRWTKGTITLQNTTVVCNAFHYGGLTAVAEAHLQYEPEAHLLAAYAVEAPDIEVTTVEPIAVEATPVTPEATKPGATTPEATKPGTATDPNPNANQ